MSAFPRILRLLSIACLALSGGNLLADEGLDFASDVQPILAAHCYECHGAETQESGLRLDRTDMRMLGGNSGAAIVPGKSGESLLIKAVRGTDGAAKMPPEDPPLSAEEIAVLVRWIDAGATAPPDEQPLTTRRESDHWSFQPLTHAAPPQVKQADLLRNPIDAFIQARLEAAGLSPSPLADKATLIRRVSLDLTGLPPTVSEVDAFLSDSREDAYDRLVDRLLSSPHYGERWGRHWLDVAHYADSNGYTIDGARSIWKYRDWVIDAFNRDLPFDEFTIDQLAGDLLPGASRDQLIATGFQRNTMVNEEGGTDKEQFRVEAVVDRISTTGSAFLGLTLGCARCHDHKFDPIDTADYYGLAGIFKSSRAMENYKKVARWHENVLPSPATDALKAEYDAKLAAKKQEIEEFIAKADEQVRTDATAGASLPEKLETLYPKETKAALKKLRDEQTALQKNPPDLPAAMGATEADVADMAIRIRGNPQKLGEVAARHVPPALRGPAAPQFTMTESGRRELAQWLIDPEHPLTSRTLVNRVWRWHFGEGLVRTPDNFGLLGEKPTHPELLDWLARRFVADGWSIKSLHRMILSSATYQQGSGFGVQGSVDPENRLFGRANVRRLEAEAVRDALLAVSGQLDAQMGGSLLTVKNRGYFFDHTSKDMTDYSSRRRSLYLPVVRNNVYVVFQLLDFPDPAIPSGDRSTTTIAPQALLMLNSDLMIDAAANLADRVLANADKNEVRFRNLYEIAYGRPAMTAEIVAGTEFVAAAEKSITATEPSQRQREVWSALCQTILAANEFVYVK
jgi:cytochrome c553